MLKTLLCTTTRGYDALLKQTRVVSLFCSQESETKAIFGVLNFKTILYYIN